MGKTDATGKVLEHYRHRLLLVNKAIKAGEDYLQHRKEAGNIVISLLIIRPSIKIK